MSRKASTRFQITQKYKQQERQFISPWTKNTLCITKCLLLGSQASRQHNLPGQMKTERYEKPMSCPMRNLRRNNEWQAIHYFFRMCPPGCHKHLDLESSFLSTNHLHYFCNYIRACIGYGPPAGGNCTLQSLTGFKHGLRMLQAEKCIHPSG